MPSILKRPLTFAPSVVNDSPQARANVKRNLREALRAAEECLGPQQIDQVVHDHRRARAGRKLDRALNDLVLAKWDASPTKDPTQFSEEFYEEFCKAYRLQSARAVETRLGRLLKAREKARDRDRKLKAALQRPSLVGEARATK
jgi:tryptophan 2,3-dioxygenase